MSKPLVSLELAKELKEAGYKQKGNWWWYSHPESDCVFVDRENIDNPDGMLVGLAVVPTLTELKNRLPTHYYVCEKALWVDDICIEIDHIDNDINKRLNYLKVFAKMWLYLKEEGLIK